MEVGGTRTFANFPNLHPEDERIVDLDMNMDAPVVKPTQTLLSKIGPAKNGATSNGDQGTSTGYSRSGHDHTTEVAPT